VKRRALGWRLTQTPYKADASEFVWIDAQLTSLEAAILSNVGGAVYATLVVRQSRRRNEDSASARKSNELAAWFECARLQLKPESD
jgi:hypothetical protein